ncbi:hypothetical protein BDF14DRAFT_1854764 [Spinellus fusiger]|nr:hypothetical protein BDF14DRAFT_1854764 [Spinellus fusiger]
MLSTSNPHHFIQSILNLLPHHSPTVHTIHPHSTPFTNLPHHSLTFHTIHPHSTPFTHFLHLPSTPINLLVVTYTPHLSSCRNLLFVTFLS